ncbi:MAG TPA: hypothetical protein VEY89_03695 [Candidatus Dormibacteraeota bacterium]|nr:hypothetical protein [Candidatus Dormibacteraeota bacterium]
MSTFGQQLRNNAVALISLAVAISGLSYNTWRNERTEHNRNVRTATFELLTRLADLQRVVYLAQYDRDVAGGNPRTGWTYVLAIHDLSAVAPTPLGSRAEELTQVWRDNWEDLGKKDEVAVDRIDKAISGLRDATLDILRALH